ncbi:MAG: hypothetical protein J6L81_04375 [Clostridia bacterium]|nr:hypothetical protein [Clostridia bacterium]
MTNQFANFFLGANSPDGFYSLFSDSYSAREGWRAYIIKGGPGTGKSTLMKKIADSAAKKGERVQRAFCSSDPQSLDAVIMPDSKTAIYDGTAPHVMEPGLPGACEVIVNLGKAFDNNWLHRRTDELIRLSESCSACHAGAVRFLRCAASFNENTSLIAAKAISREKVDRRAKALFDRYVQTGGEGNESVRLLSAVTMNGITFFENTIANLCDTVIPIDDKYGCVSDALLGSIRALLIKSRCEFISCRCSQSRRLEHIIVPESRVAFTTCGAFHGGKSDTRLMHARRFMDTSVIDENSKRFSYNKRAASEFFDLASQEMRRAKAIHDKLEEIYSSAVDFSVVDEICENLKNEMSL